MHVTRDASLRPPAPCRLSAQAMEEPAMNALIVIGDGPESIQALERVPMMPAEHLDTVLLLHVIRGSPFYGRGLPVWDEWDDLAAEYARSATLLERAAQRLRARGLRARISTESVVGDPLEVIPQAAADMGADVIVLGTRLGAAGAACPATTPEQRSVREDAPAHRVEE